MDTLIVQNIKNSTIDGIFANMFATLTGGVFLTGFALQLGMDEFMIGLLAAMPFIVTVFQLPVSFISAKSGKRKSIALLSSFLARFIWLSIVVVALCPSHSSESRAKVILGLIFLSYTFATCSYVTWLSWIADIIPNRVRGRFFGTRNMFCGAAGMLAMLIFGRVLDTRLGMKPLGAIPLGFTLTFLSAVLFGMLSLNFLRKMTETTLPGTQTEGAIDRKWLLHPLKDPNFKNFLSFAFLWGFSVHFASPFVTLYLLRDLKFDYGFVAVLGIVSSFFDLTGMHLWGRISDRVKNKAVIQLASWVAIFLPLAWAMVRPGNFILPVILHILGGGFWAGINLCMNNLLLRISHQEKKTFFYSAYHIAGGLGAAGGPIVSGVILAHLSHLDFNFFGWKVFPLQIIFLTSTLLRFLSFQVFKHIHEPDESTARDVVRILRSIRGLNISNGYNGLLHPYMTIDKKKEE